MQFKEAIKWVGAGALGLTMLGCGEPTAGENLDVEAATQQLRAGHGPDGQTFVGLDFLATDPGLGHALISCRYANLDLSLSYSVEGEDGPYIPIGTAEDLGCQAVKAGDFSLVLDNSGSEEEWIDEIRGASGTIVDRLLLRGGRASLVRVSTEASVLSELTDDEVALGAALDSMHVNNGWTALYDGIRLANETLADGAQTNVDVTYPNAQAFCEQTRRLGVVAVTDGRENNSNDEKADPERYPGDGVDTSLDDLLRLNVAGITTPIYTLGVGDDVDHDALSELATASGGRHMALADVQSVKHTFDLIADYTEGRYQFCAEMPELVCGSIHVHVEYTWSQRGKAKHGERTEELVVPCPPAN